MGGLLFLLCFLFQQIVCSVVMAMLDSLWR